MSNGKAFRAAPVVASIQALHLFCAQAFRRNRERDFRRQIALRPTTKLLFYCFSNLESKQSGRPGSYSSIHR
jgi:hypothetical protein